jgi:membrane-associated phospholipid phosphatase
VEVHERRLLTLLLVASFLVLFAVLWAIFFAAGPALERTLAFLANRTARFRYRDYLPVFVLLAAGLAITMFAGDAFLDLAELVQSQSPRLQEIDKQAHHWASTQRRSGPTLFFTTMTIIGTPVGLAIIAVIISALLVARGRWRWALYVMLTGSLGGLLNLQLKAYFARARPELSEALRDAHGYSFPSGHAMGSTIVFGTLAYVAFRVLKRWRTRAAAISAAATIVAAIATSRVYLGVHWISDIAAGVAAGLIWLTTATIAYEAIRRIRLIRSLRSRADAA